MDKPPNPLLTPLGPYRDLAELAANLEHNPLDTFPTSPSPEQRDEYLDYIKKRFAVTRPALQLAHEIQSMIRAGYRERNPCEPKNRRKLYKLADLQDGFDVVAAAYYPDSRCLVVEGITGMGKSASVQRVLEQYQQVIVHGRNDDAGWLKHTQIVHLTVKMSDTGSRGGFVDGVLFALDNLLGTDYFNATKKERTVDRRSLKIAQLLALHSVGLLIIEEMQPENFMESKYRKELNVFFLSILSFGVPLLLLGNPRAFEKLSEHKQTERRYLSYEPITLWPHEGPEDRDWARAIAPACWQYQVIDKAVAFDATVARALWECSGGVPGYASKLVVEIQKSILRGAITQMSVEAIRWHYANLASFASFRPVIEGLVNKDDRLLSEGKDIPVEAFVRRWKKSAQVAGIGSHDQKGGSVAPKENDGSWDKFSGRQTKKRKTSVSKTKNKKKKNVQVLEDADQDDLRRADQAKAALNKSLETLKHQIEEDQRTTK